LPAMPETTVANTLRRPRAVRKSPIRQARPSEPDGGESRIDTRYLETLLGYNARRAALAIIEVFLEQMSVYGLRPVDFSVLSLVRHNPGITSRQLCQALGLLPPNLVGLIQSLERRGLIERHPHPHDGRAMGLHLTASGDKMMQAAEITATELEISAAARLSMAERKTLIRLLQKVYL
jgi:DNA-binding MarR family transcriptional regulator